VAPSWRTCSRAREMMRRSLGFEELFEGAASAGVHALADDEDRGVLAVVGDE